MHEALSRVWNVINRFRLRIKPTFYTETSSLIKFDLVPLGDTRISEIMKYEQEFKSAFNKKATLDYGNGLIYLVIPKQQPDIVSLIDLLQKDRLYNVEGKLKIIFGEDSDGDIIVADLVDLKHILIAGETGGGKSVCVHSIIVSLINYCSPSEIRFVLIDFKGNEFKNYEDISFLAKPVIYDFKKAVITLEWLVKEMEHRYDILQMHGGIRNIIKYNETANNKLPHIACVIDEFADIIRDKKYGEKAENLIIRLAQKARAAGIHLIIATQKPSVDVITSQIKSNITTRIAFAVPEWRDSQTILDENGAENLNKKGDMLLKDDEDTYRIQGAFISEDELDDFLKQYKVNNVDYIEDEPEPDYLIANISEDEEIEEDDIEIEIDEFICFEKAARFCIENNICSRTSVQRCLKRGWPLVDQILKKLQKYKVVGTDKEGRDYPILMDLETLESLLPDIKKEFEEEYYG